MTLRTEVFSGLALFAPTRGLDGAVELVGGSASLRLFDLVEGEVGLGFWGNPCGASLSPAARLGVSPSVLSPSPSGTRWELRIPLLVDYNYLRIDGTGCDTRPDQRIHSLRGATGLDATFWGSRHLGFNLRALGFAGLAHETSFPCVYCEPGPGTVSDHFAFGATLSIGLAVKIF